MSSGVALENFAILAAKLKIRNYTLLLWFLCMVCLFRRNRVFLGGRDGLCSIRLETLMF